MPTVGSRTGTQRAMALGLLLIAGIVSLPVVAAFLDGESTVNLLVPVQLAAMATVGAVVGCLLPGIAGSGSSSTRSAGLGALVGVATALVGVVIFFLLLGG